MFNFKVKMESKENFKLHCALFDNFYFLLFVSDYDQTEINLFKIHYFICVSDNNQ